MIQSFVPILVWIPFSVSVGNQVTVDAASFSPNSRVYGYLERTLYETIPVPHAPVYRQTVDFVWCDTNRPTKRSSARVVDIGKGHPSSALVGSTVFRFSPDSRRVLTLSPSGLSYVELTSGKSVVLLGADQQPRCAAWLSDDQIGIVRLSPSSSRERVQVVSIAISEKSPIITTLHEDATGSIPEVTWSYDGRWALIHPTTKHGWRFVNSRDSKTWTTGTLCTAGSVATWSPDGNEVLCVEADLFCEDWKCRRVNVSSREDEDLTSNLKDIGIAASSFGVCCKSHGIGCDENDHNAGAIWLKDGRHVLLGNMGGLLDLDTPQVVTINREGHRKTGLDFARVLYPTAVAGWYLAKRTKGGTEYVLVSGDFETVRPLTEFSTEWREYFSPGVRLGIFSPNGVFAARLAPDQSQVMIEKLSQPLRGLTKHGG